MSRSDSGVVGDLRRRTREALTPRFAVDPRALATLRISLGLLLLSDLLLRSSDIQAFYTDAGVLPRAALYREFPGIAAVSIHALSGAGWVQIGLFLFAAVFALALLVGYRTRLSTAASLVLLVSLHARNPLLLNAGDALLRRLLFWGLFLPLGARWSVDTRRGEELRGPVATLATAALLLQVVIVYTTNAALKLQGDLWRSGEAIRYVFGLDHLTVLAGDALAGYPTLLVAMDRLWLAMIVTSVLLVVLTGRLRTALVAAFVAAHLGMALSLRLGLFPLISIAALLPFLPSTVWDAAERTLPGSLRRAVDRGLDRLDRSLPRSTRPHQLAFGHPWRGSAATVVVATVLALLLVWNVAAFGLVDLPSGVTGTADPEEYRWDMFAPEPRTDDGWYVVPGRLASGDRVDAFHGGPVERDRPPELAATFPSHRWFVYLLDLRRPTNAPLRDDFAAYLCGRWNGDHEDRLVSLTVYFVEEPVRLDGPEERRRVELVRYDCSGD